MFAIDEACYIPLWGLSFRPAFQDLAWLREALLGRKAKVMALRDWQGQEVFFFSNLGIEQLSCHHLQAGFGLDLMQI